MLGDSVGPIGLCPNGKGTEGTTDINLMFLRNDTDGANNLCGTILIRFPIARVSLKENQGITKVQRSQTSEPLGHCGDTLDVSRVRNDNVESKTWERCRFYLRSPVKVN